MNTLMNSSDLCVEMVVHGVAFHHAGMEYSDRRAVEELFTLGDLPVLRESIY